MAISVVKKNVEGKVPTWRGFIADTIADLALLPISPAVAMGSECYCSEDGNTYILETDGDWVVKKGSSGGGGGGTGGDTIADLVVHVQVYEVYDEEENLTYDIESDKTATEVYNFILDNPDKLVVAVVGYGEKWEEDGETGSYIDHTNIYNYCDFNNFFSIGTKGFYCYNSRPFVTYFSAEETILSDYKNSFSFLGIKEDSYDDETDTSTYVWLFNTIENPIPFEQSSPIPIAPRYGYPDYQTYVPAILVYRFMCDVRDNEKYNNIYLVRDYSDDNHLRHVDYYRINCFEILNGSDADFLHVQASRQEYVNEDGVYTHILHTVLDSKTLLDEEHLAEPMIFNLTELTSDVTTI